jgi:hypothetical protein
MQRLVVLILSCTGGCALHRATPTPHAGSVARNDADLQCASEHITGTLIPTRVCTVKSQRDATQKNTQDVRDFLNKQVMPACPGSPGC